MSWFKFLHAEGSPEAEAAVKAAEEEKKKAKETLNQQKEELNRARRVAQRIDRLTAANHFDEYLIRRSWGRSD